MVIAAALVLASCGGDDGGSDGGSSTTTAAAVTTTAAGGSTTPTTPSTANEGSTAPSTTASAGTPVSGGTLTYGTLSEVTSLDPVVNSGSGNSGGTELFALYDSLMTYDTTTGTFKPQLAESLEPNADNTVWTLKLRPDITFSDGTPYDATAVVYNLQRQVDKKGRSIALVSFMKSFAVIDPLTVEITLTEPNTTVPYSLASPPGAIASPAAIEKAGENFGTNPGAAGAGPFLFDSFKPKEALVLKRNPDYWNGPAYLDELKFVTMATQATTLEGMKSGSLQGAFIRDPAVLADARDAGFSEVVTAVNAGNTIDINDGASVTCKDQQPASVCGGQADGAVVKTTPPTADKRVRQAVAAAINLDALNDRSFQGKAPVDSALFSPSSHWSDGSPGPQYDVAKAKQLVEEVKAEGKWDGSIRVLCHTGLPDWGIAVQTMLEAAGFKVDLNGNQDLPTVIAAVQVQKDYDLACFGTSVYDEEPFAPLVRQFTFDGYSNPDVLAALQAGRKASTDDEKRAALEVVIKAYNEDVPFLSLMPVIQSSSFVDGVEGVTQSSGSTARFDKAWLSS